MPILMILGCMCSAQAETEVALRPVQTIPLPDVDGRIDHVAIDVKGQRAFLAALAKNSIEVVDLEGGRVSRSLPGFAKPQGVLFVHELNKLFVATGNDGVLHTLDGTTLSVIRTAVTSAGADALGYDPRSKYLYVGSGGRDSNKESGDLTVIDASSGGKIAAMVTDAHAGASAFDALGPHLFVLVPDKGEVIVLDRNTRAQMARWTIPGIHKDVAIALDETNHRLLLGVRDPASIVVLDSNSGAVVASIPTVGILDGLSYDPAARRIYTTGGEGFLDVTRQIDADHYERIARLPTAPGARTSTFVPEWRRLFVAVPRDGDRGAELRVFEVVP